MRLKDMGVLTVIVDAESFEKLRDELAQARVEVARLNSGVRDAAKMLFAASGPGGPLHGWRWDNDAGAWSNRPMMLERELDEILFGRIVRCLGNVKSPRLLGQIRFVGDLVQLTEAELLSVRGFGRQSFREVKDVLADMGLSLGMTVDDWPQTRERLIRERDASTSGTT